MPNTMWDMLVFSKAFGVCGGGGGVVAMERCVVVVRG